MQIAYLINQYPKTSHSFIRREIIALEAMGISITRFSIRTCREQLVEPADKEELAKTKVILEEGIIRLLLSLILVAITKPITWLKALLLTIKIGVNSDRGLLLNFAYLAEACIVLKWSQQSNISHIHAHFGTNSTTVAMLCNLLGGPSYSFTVHGPEEFDKSIAIALPEKIARAKFVIAISSFGKSQLYRWCNYQDWSKIKIVHCGLDTAFLEAEFEPITQENRLVCVGRLSEQKGQLLLVKAIHQLVTKGVDLQLVLVGDGELRQPIEALIKEYNLEKQITITGWATNEEVKKEILAAKALVLPSFAEGLPVVIMESLALNRPVISTYVAGIPELVIPNECGWLIPAGCVEALTEVISYVLELPVTKLTQMGKTGATTITKEYNITQETKKLATLFESKIIDC